MNVISVRPTPDLRRKIRKLMEFGKPYKFTLTLELTVEGVDKVPSWEELKKDLCQFFHERGLLAELKEEDKDILSWFRKPLP